MDLDSTLGKLTAILVGLIILTGVAIPIITACTESTADVYENSGGLHTYGKKLDSSTHTITFASATKEVRVDGTLVIKGDSATSFPILLSDGGSITYNKLGYCTVDVWPTTEGGYTTVVDMSIFTLTVGNSAFSLSYTTTGDSPTTGTASGTYTWGFSVTGERTNWTMVSTYLNGYQYLQSTDDFYGVYAPHYHNFVAVHKDTVRSTYSGTTFTYTLVPVGTDMSKIAVYHNATDSGWGTQILDWVIIPAEYVIYGSNSAGPIIALIPVFASIGLMLMAVKRYDSDETR